MPKQFPQAGGEGMMKLSFQYVALSNKRLELRQLLVLHHLIHGWKDHDGMLPGR